MSNFAAISTSPAFTITAEEFLWEYLASVTRVTIDGVEPPRLGLDLGYSYSMAIMNEWSPWIDDKIVEPKFDGVCQYLGTVSNQPTLIRDYHWIALMRAVDYLLAPRYVGLILALVDTAVPIPPPLPND